MLNTPLIPVTLQTNLAHSVDVNLIGMNIRDFFAQHPDHRVVKEWRGTPDQLDLNKSDRHTKVRWECIDCHQQWDAVPYHRLMPRNMIKKVNCPICSGLLIVPGYNDLSTTYPELVKEWSPLNVILPTEVSSSSSKKVSWICPVNNRHTWDASVSERTRRSGKDPTGCPYCLLMRRRNVSRGEDLLTRCPEVAALWDHEKNIDGPETYSPASRSQVWWTDIDQPASIISRTGFSGRNKGLKRTSKPISSTHPEVSAFLSKQDAESYSIGTKKTLPFICPEGHEWSQRPVNFIRDGGCCPHCSGRRLTEGVNDVATLIPELVQYASPEHQDLLSFERRTSNSKIEWVCDNGHKSVKPVVYVTRHFTPDTPFPCQYCGTSSGENSLAEFLESHVRIIRNDRSVIVPRELDIYIPEKKIAVEFNGLYWHSEKFVDRNYHYDKWRRCKEQGIQLITVWEDEWRENPDLIKLMLLRKLGVSTEKRVPARKCVVREVDYEKASEFLGSHHIQGSIRGSCYLSLMHDDEMVAVLVTGNTGDVLRVERYASSCLVQGGYTKLLTHVENRSEAEKIVTFSDNCISDGGLYASTGFSAVEELPPDYRYVYENKRRHKFGFRLKRFRSDPALFYREGLTERELADRNDIPRIWDCGKTRWEKSLTS